MRSTIFTRNSPSLDLHGEFANAIEVLINEFINDNVILGNKYVSIVHGKGNGILKKQTHLILKKNSQVTEYKINMWNDGETIVELDIK